MTSVSTKKSRPVSTLSLHKHCVGIDVSKDSLEVCFASMDGEQTMRVKASKKFGNRPSGWKALDSWIKRLRTPGLPLWVVMEATGVYYEGLAYHLKTLGYQVAVVLPNKTKSYMQSLNLKSKTDALEARALAQMGLERKMKPWFGFSPTMLTLKHLCREREALQQDLVAASNRLHAHKHEHQAEKKTLQRARQHIKFLQQQIEAIDAQLQITLQQDTDLKAKVDKVCTIKGVSTLTAIIVISETNGFELFENKAQLVSYAGYDVVERQSGASVKGKTRISKKGNAHLRRAMYYPALTAARFNPHLANLYQRVMERNPKTKMIAYVAVQRKLLILIYTLFKKNTAYDPYYNAAPLAKPN